MMRFHLGPFPENKDFDPESEGWSALPDLNLDTIHRRALRASMGLFLLWFPLFLLVFPLEVLTPQKVPLSPNVFRIQIPIFQMPVWLLFTMLVGILILFLPAHEVIHALCCPGWGLSSKTVLGLWLPKGFLYVHHDAPMARNRFMFVLLAPYLFLSLLPLALIAMLRFSGWTPEVLLSLAWLSLLGSLLAGGDFVSFGALWSANIPGAALVRNVGQNSYWKPIAKKQLPWP
jgi:hypothetical protein